MFYCLFRQISFSYFVATRAKEKSAAPQAFKEYNNKHRENREYEKVQRNGKSVNLSGKLDLKSKKND